jgi:nickel-type superoxide dismutase maturation protease
MRPTLEPGDRLYVDTRAYRERLPAAGEIVVLRDPETPERWLVKRVRSADPGGVVVAGDAPELSRDSRRFGPVPPASIVGRAYRCYAPPERQRDL